MDAASAGDAEAAKRRLAPIGEIETVQSISPEAVALAQKLVSANALPAKAEADALYVAIAAMWKSDFLLTWETEHGKQGQETGSSLALSHFSQETAQVRKETGSGLALSHFSQLRSEHGLCKPNERNLHIAFVRTNKVPSRLRATV